MSGTSITQWLQSLPIPWLFGETNGQAAAGAEGTTYDNQVSLLKQASAARFTMNAPADALPHIGNDSVLIQGPGESNAEYQVRLRTRWDDWSRAGMPLELLVQLYWQGYGGAVIATQNGLLYSLSGAPTAGVDPTSLLVITPCAGLNAPLTSGVTDVVIPATSVTSYSDGATVATPWWTFDDNNTHCSRFCVLIPTPPLSWTIYADALFDGSTDTVTADWSLPFPDATYQFSRGVYVTDSTTNGPVIISVIAKTPTSITVSASRAFTGNVYLLGWEIGSAPFSSPPPTVIGTLKSVIATWKPAKALCVGVYAIIQGRAWDYPPRNWGDGITWGPSTVQFIEIGA